MSKIISVWSQKGGVAKTTLTVLLAAHYNWHGYDVSVIDADKQQSMKKNRDMDINQLKSDERLQQLFFQKGVKPFKIISSKLTELGEILPQLKDDDTPNRLIFVDLPGTVDAAGIASVCQYLDVVIVPFESDPYTFASSMETLTLFRGFEKQQNRSIQKLMLWVKYVKSERQGFYEQVERMITSQKDVDVLKYKFPNSVTWKRERSTMIPTDKIDPLVEELSERIRLISL